MNEVIITGFLAGNPELKKTRTGKSVVSVDVAIKRKASKDNIDYIPIVCWEKNAEFLSHHFVKGDGIEIYGSLSTRTFLDNGKTRKVVEVSVNYIEFPKAKKTSPPSAIVEDEPFYPPVLGDC